MGIAWRTACYNALFATDRRICRSTFAVNGLTLLVVLALAIGIVVAWRAGIVRGKREAEAAGRAPPLPAAIRRAAGADSGTAARRQPASRPRPAMRSPPNRRGWCAASKARTPRCAALRRRPRPREALEVTHAEERRRLLVECEHARAETARYREIVVDLENNALPPLLDGPNMPTT